MQQAQKAARQDARRWGRAALGNHKTAMYGEEQARTWASIAAGVERNASADDSEEERQASADALAHAREQERILRQIAESQDEQVKVNARRAFHAAILSAEEQEVSA